MRLALDVLTRYAQLASSALRPPRSGVAPATARHYLVTAGLLLLLPAFLAYHWLGLLLDEILFRGYRRVEVRQPLFVLGVPRSGTTAVHRCLARDRGFTTFSTWEAVFGISVTWRRFWSALGRIDRAAGGPAGRALDAVTRRLAGGLAGIHAVERRAPEEDYLALLPILACFILVVPFPDARYLWRLGRGDVALTADERRRILRFHRRCVQRHLYVHGTRRRFLSKNASFAPLVEGLLETYPDARIVCCLRDPGSAVSSQLAALDPALRAVHGGYRRAAFRDAMLDQLGFYYRHLLEHLQPRPRQAVVVAAESLRRDLRGTLERALGTLAIPWRRPPCVDGTGGAGAHRHALADFGLDEAAIERSLGDVRRRLRAIRPRDPSERGQQA